MENAALVNIWVSGVEVLVPGDATLLRALQFLNMRSVTGAGFCWNAECAMCEADVDFGDGLQTVLACQAKVRPGMRVLGLSAVLQQCVRGLRDQDQERRTGLS